MADTKLEMEQSIYEDNRKRELENKSVAELLDLIYETHNILSYKRFEETFKNDILQFIIDNNIDLE